MECTRTQQPFLKDLSPPIQRGSGDPFPHGSSMETKYILSCPLYFMRILCRPSQEMSLP